LDTSKPDRTRRRSSEASKGKRYDSVCKFQINANEIKNEWSRASGELPTWDGYLSARPILIADLHDFEIYVSPNDAVRGYELIGLHHLESPKAKKLTFDGSLRIEAEEHYVEGITIHDFSIEGFGDQEDPTVAIYIQSATASKDSTHDIWYRLNNPTQLYKRHHKPFLWVAQLCKHVLDFMDEHCSVGLESFRIDFQQWLTTRFHQHTDFQHWYHAIHDHEDFRVPVNTYIQFLYQQAYNLPNSKALRTHPVWADCMVAGLTRVKKQDVVITGTLATPNVHQCFQHMYFGHVIQAKFPSKAVRAAQQKRMAQLRFSRDPSKSSHTDFDVSITAQPYRSSLVKVGDVVAFDPSKSDKQNWRNADCEWLLFVHDIQLLSNGVQRLFGLYLYRPHETNIFTAKYRYQNELFFSDNCNCDDGELFSTDINGYYNIEWSPSIIPGRTFFIRQTYMTQDSAFVTYTEKHKVCECKKERVKQTSFDRYHRGDTIYVTKRVQGQKVLEPMIVYQKEKMTGCFIARRFARLKRDYSQEAERAQRGAEIARNELVLTDEYEEIAIAQIERECYIRFISKQDILQSRIPLLYNRGGAGDFWFFSMGLTVKDGTPRLTWLARPPKNFNEGHDSTDLSSPCIRLAHTSTCDDVVLQASVNRLSGMSLFSGGGNLDRGIEEGGAVEIRTAVELDDAAIHTLRANTRDPTKKMLWYGSVDDHLNAALDGSTHPLLAHIGNVNIIIAGSSCPGYSTLQKDILSSQSIAYASHITTLCSYADLVRPEYAILENVLGMTATRKGFEDQNVLSQLVACFVSMGYQVNQFIMDAWNYGSGQQRSRVILTIAAPGLHLIEQPKHTHSMLADDTRGRSLGMLPNGQRFGQREYYPTPFAHITAGEMTADIPDIGNGNIQTCISHPSHRVAEQPTHKDRALLECIPHDPPGCGYREAHQLGLIPESLQKPGKETDKAFKRIKESGLVPTITTRLIPRDSHNGASLHWSQDRPITLLEARRTQGYLDNEPIIGILSDQYRIVGNAVDRQVAFALGLAIRQAVIRNVRESLTAHKATEPMQELLVDVEENVDHFSDASSDSMDMLGLDGSSDPRDIEDEPSPSTTTTDFLSRISSTIVGGITALTHRSRSTLATQETTSPAGQASAPNHLKRSRQGTPISNSAHHEHAHDFSNLANHSNDIPSPAAVRNTMNLNTKRKSTDAEHAHKKRRSTRHSGLEVAFLPKQWNKNPEKEYAAKK
jgi:DNA (cytosine-5)-methyltransferase 1